MHELVNHIGQDESFTYKAYPREGNERGIRGARGFKEEDGRGVEGGGRVPVPFWNPNNTYSGPSVFFLNPLTTLTPCALPSRARDLYMDSS